MNSDTCSFETAAHNHLRDALGMTVAERWRWLDQAMAFGSVTARARAVKGLISLGPHGELIGHPYMKCYGHRNTDCPMQLNLPHCLRSVFHDPARKPACTAR